MSYVYDSHRRIRVEPGLTPQETLELAEVLDLFDARLIALHSFLAFCTWWRTADPDAATFEVEVLARRAAA